MKPVVFGVFVLGVALTVDGCNIQRAEENATAKPQVSEARLEVSDAKPAISEEKKAIAAWPHVVAGVAADMEAYNRTTNGAYQQHYSIVGNDVKRSESPQYPASGSITYDFVNSDANGRRLRKDPLIGPTKEEFVWDTASGKWRMVSEPNLHDPIARALFKSVLGR